MGTTNDIKRIREISGMTQKEFSETYGIPVRTLSNWESGQRKCPEYMEKILNRIVVEDDNSATLPCYDPSALKEIGFIYGTMIGLLDNDFHDPFLNSEIFPIKSFIMMYKRIIELKALSRSLDSRIQMLMCQFTPDEFGKMTNGPAPMMGQRAFICGMSEARLNYMENKRNR